MAVPAAVRMGAWALGGAAAAAYATRRIANPNGHTVALTHPAAASRDPAGVRQPDVAAELAGVLPSLQAETVSASRWQPSRCPS